MNSEQSIADICEAVSPCGTPADKTVGNPLGHNQRESFRAYEQLIFRTGSNTLASYVVGYAEAHSASPI